MEPPSKTPPAWDLVGTEKLQDCTVFSVWRTWARHPRRRESHPFYRIESSDWVNVVPLTAADEIVLVRQFRHGSQGHSLELPGGMVDAGESPAAAAARELLEETGYRGARVEPLGSVNPNPGLFRNRCHTFLVRDARAVAEVQNVGTEETRVELVPREAIPELTRSGEIDHALVVAALYWLDHAG